MEESLKSRGKEPVSDFCRWNENLATYARNADLPDVFDSSTNYTPSSAKPLVYHLHGDMNVPQSMILTEKDYIDFFINFSNKNSIIPSFIRKKMITTPLLLLGFQFDSVYTRITFEYLFRNLNLSDKSNTLVLSPLKDEPDKEESENYVGKELQFRLSSYVIWQDVSTFLISLKTSLNKFRHENNAR
jgi:hypothetical protein